MKNIKKVLILALVFALLLPSAALANKLEDVKASGKLLVGTSINFPPFEFWYTDPATGDVLPVGETGEICARGFNQLIEYLHDPDATARAIDTDGFVRTGDLGRLDERGYLTVTGRVSGTGMAMGRRPASLARRQIRSAYCPFIGTRKAPPAGTKVRIAASTTKWPEPCRGSVT